MELNPHRMLMVGISESDYKKRFVISMNSQSTGYIGWLVKVRKPIAWLDDVSTIENYEFINKSGELRQLGGKLWDVMETINTK